MGVITVKETKKLRRSKTDKWLAGVCGGIGEYIGIDPIIVRLIFLVLPGMNLIIYIILALLLSVND